MIVYLDASALVKRYAAEASSRAVGQLITTAEVLGTSLVTRAEVSAALAKAVRTLALSEQQSRVALHTFRAQWTDLARLQITETTVERADALAWQYGLRGYDAVHLAAALVWQETIMEPVTLATFDRQLWQSGQASRLAVWPPNLAEFTSKRAPLP
jgi:predicted nucleic acid-binding protein